MTSSSRRAFGECWQNATDGCRRFLSNFSGRSRPSLPAEAAHLVDDLVGANHENIPAHAELTHLIRSPSGKSFPAKYDVTKKSLGSGMSGSVMRAHVREQDYDVAVKVLPTEGLSELQREQLLDEIANQLSMDHPNIAKLLEVFVEPKCMRLVIERMHGPNLLDHLNSRGYSEKNAANVVQQMLKAVAYCHSQSVVHRDLKLENFCLSNHTAQARVKMIDFGLSDKLEMGQPLTHACGSLLYVAPEVLKKKYTEKADMWSMGVITYALLFGQPPFDGRNDQELCANICRGKLRFPSGKVSNTAKRFIEQLLEKDPEKRLSAREALKDEWFKKMEDKDAKDEKLDDNILAGLRRLQRSNGLKQALLATLAPKATAKEVAKWADQFETLDEAGTGMVKISDMVDRLVKLSDCSESEAEDIARHLAALREESKKANLAALGDDDTISYSAFLAACLSSNMAMLNKNDLEGLFNKLDKDGNNKIDREELKRALEGVIREEDIPEGNLTSEDVKWLLLGPRWSEVGTTQHELERLLGANGVWRSKKRRDHASSADVGQELQSDLSIQIQSEASTTMKAKEDSKGWLKQSDAEWFEAKRAENLAFRNFHVGITPKDESNSSISTSLLPSQSSITVDEPVEAHLTSEEFAEKSKKASKQAVKEISGVEKTRELHNAWSDATNAAKDMDDFEARRRENLAFRKMQMDAGV